MLVRTHLSPKSNELGWAVDLSACIISNGRCYILGLGLEVHRSNGDGAPGTIGFGHHAQYRRSLVIVFIFLLA